MRALASLLLLVLPPPLVDPQPVAYQRPVDAPISDPFRAPATPYGPGNRGLEFDTAPGATVRAAAAGEVTFAGPVAGRRYVTLLHADGVRTAYGPLGRVAVALGARVTTDQAIGTATGPMLWTARIGDVYIDPAVLLAASGDREVRLVAGPGDRTVAIGRAAVSACAALWALATPC